ncbi:hypothetical protein MHI43_05195 [Paenibacillus sp. FSL H8-0457]|uniref:hypothetical protein n=1 Tax=unclassified Paenibacillus TaxID=185978 RepID=UPI0003E1FE49|nr:hypothetical protein [Paenibacillus sp. FSL H8-457]ETT65670.1 hypothetical protein C172_11486 [Paenibacillus sp. FSL H8-457]
MKRLLMIMMLYITALLVGCEKEPGWETMQLLDEQVAEIRISAFETWDEMNGDTLLSFKEAKDVRAFEEAIRTARKQPDDAKRTDPDYDVMVVYAQQSPIHAVKLWLGEEGQESVFSYGFKDWGEDVYVVSAKHTDRMRELILPEGR